MSLIYRSMSANNKLADILVEGPTKFICSLRDSTNKTESKVECRSLSQAEKLVEQFLRPKNPY